jgi:phage terminase small subunit
MQCMARSDIRRAERPPDEFQGEDRVLWLRVMRALRRQRLWEPTDADLVTLYVVKVTRARAARGAGRPDLEAERDVMALADRLLLTPDARRRAGMNPKVPTGGHAEANGSISGVF